MKSFAAKQSTSLSCTGELSSWIVPTRKKLWIVWNRQCMHLPMTLKQRLISRKPAHAQVGLRSPLIWRLTEYMAFLCHLTRAPIHFTTSHLTRALTECETTETTMCQHLARASRDKVSAPRARSVTSIADSFYTSNSNTMQVRFEHDGQ